MNAIGHMLRARAENVLALLLGSMFVTFILQITFRYVLGWSVGWTIEWVTIAWLWGILFGYAFVVRDDDVIRLDIIYAALPHGAQRVLDVFAGLTCAAIFIYTLPDAWDYITFMHREKTAYMRWPFDYVFAIYVPFAISVIIRSLLLAWRGATGRTAHEAIEQTAESHDHD